MAPKNMNEQEKVRQAVLRLHALGGMSLGAIGKHPEVQRSKSTVQYISKAFSQRNEVTDKNRYGRPYKMGKRRIVANFQAF